MGVIRDRGERGFELRDKTIKTVGAAWIEPQGAITFFDDFIGKALNGTDTWTSTSTGSGTAWVVDSDAGDPSAGHGGWIAAATENIDAAAEELALTTESVKGNFLVSRAGKGLLVFETVLSLAGATTAKIAMAGFTDDETEGAAMAFGYSGTTLTTTATDGAMWLYDSLATTDAWRGVSVNNDADGSIIVSEVAEATATATKLRIEIDSAGNAFFFQSDQIAGGVTPAYQGSEPLAVATTLKAIPYIAVGSTTTTAATLECDYVFVAMAR